MMLVIEIVHMMLVTVRSPHDVTSHGYHEFQRFPLRWALNGFAREQTVFFTDKNIPILLLAQRSDVGDPAPKC